MDEDKGRCFEQLLEDVPRWTAELNGLIQGIEEWQHEFGNTPIEQAPRLKKSSSTESMRPAEETTRSRSRGRRFGSRDRGSNAPSLNSRFGRQFGAGYYSANIQRQMETLVKGVSIGRGYVRKGKMCARINDITRRAVENQASDAAAGYSEPCLQRTAAVELDIHRTTTAKAFDELDSALLECQSLCENAAHFLLRDGDCDGELDEVKGLFADIVRICECEKAKVAANMEKTSPFEEEPALEPTLEQRPEVKPAELSPHIFQQPVMSLNSLEVDTDEDQEDQKEMDDFFFMKMPNLRVTRMATAH